MDYVFPIIITAIVTWLLCGWKQQRALNEVLKENAILRGAQQDAHNWLLELRKAMGIEDAKVIDYGSLIAIAKSYKDAYDEWLKKTDWVQETDCPAGIHRADYMTTVIKRYRDLSTAIQLDLSSFKECVP